MASTGGKVKVRMREFEVEKAKTLDDGDTPGPPGTLTVNRSGRAGLKKGADTAVGKWTTRKTEQPQEAVATTSIGRKGTVMHR
jgi:hypothetical protein